MRKRITVTILVVLMGLLIAIAGANLITKNVTDAPHWVQFLILAGWSLMWGYLAGMLLLIIWWDDV